MLPLSPVYTDARNALDLSRCTDGIEFIRAHELIAFHRNSDFEFLAAVTVSVTVAAELNGGNIASQNFSETTNANRRVASGQCDQIFDAIADLEVGEGQKTNTTRTDVPGFFDTVHFSIAQTDDSQRQLHLIALCPPLFQAPTVMDTTC